jgi:hypothetical protein
VLQIPQDVAEEHEAQLAIAAMQLGQDAVGAS